MPSSLPAIICGRCLTQAITDAHKHDPCASIAAFDDPFRTGAVRHFLLRLYRSGLYRYPRNGQLLSAEGWDEGAFEGAVRAVRSLTSTKLCTEHLIETLYRKTSTGYRCRLSVKGPVSINSCRAFTWNRLHCRFRTTKLLKPSRTLRGQMARFLN